MDVTIAVLLVVAALIAGMAVGWVMGGRPVADWRTRHREQEAEAKALAEKLARMAPELALMSERAERADSLAALLSDAETARNEATTGLAALRSESAERVRTAEAQKEEIRRLRDRLDETEQARRIAENDLFALRSEAVERDRAAEKRLQEQEKHFAREIARLVEAEEKLQAKFNEIGEKLLAGARSRFLEDAQMRLETLSKESLAQLEKKVGPVGETLERYRKRVEELEQNRVTDFQQLHGVISEVRAGQERVMEGANRITTTLRGATKARGDWGELQLANLLESCGLYDKADFNFQLSVKGSDGETLRPDAVLRIPGGKCLVVDVKNVFNTYARANEAASEEERLELLRAHARELRGHIDELAAKRYQDHVEGAADFVVLFVPGEHVLYAALTQDHGLLDYALKRNIVLSSPLNFMSIALTVSTVWRQAGVQADAAEIAALGKELYDRLAVVAGHLSKLRGALYSTNQHFDALIGSFDKNLRRTGERFEKLSVDTSAKELQEAPPLNMSPRRLSNFPDHEEPATPRLVEMLQDGSG